MLNWLPRLLLKTTTFQTILATKRGLRALEDTFLENVGILDRRIDTLESADFATKDDRLLDIVSLKRDAKHIIVTQSTTETEEKAILAHMDKLGVDAVVVSGLEHFEIFSVEK